jgi:Tfp pilus assembly protein PilX
MNKNHFPVSMFKCVLMMAVLILLVVSAPASSVSAEYTAAVISPQVDIIVGPGIQGWYGYSVAFDSMNSRYLVVSDNWDYPTEQIGICGQLVNADGSLYGDRISIAVYGLSPRVAFDSNNGGFLVAFQGGSFTIYGQLVNSDGSLSGSNFVIPVPPPIMGTSEIQLGGSPMGVEFDPTSGRFFVLLWMGRVGGIWLWNPYNLYGQFVNASGYPSGTYFPITSFVGDDYGVRGCALSYDPQNHRFLAAYAHYDTTGLVLEIRGHLIGSGGAFYGEEITIFQSAELIRLVPAKIPFDSANGRFLVMEASTSGTYGQLVNADGTLHGEPVLVCSPIAPGWPNVTSAVFDSSAGRFLITATYDALYGQVLNADGSRDGSLFVIDSYNNPYGVSAAFGNAETGSLVVYNNASCSLDPSTDFSDIFGRFVRLELRKPPDQPANVSPADGSSSISLTPTLQSSPFSDPDTGDTHAASQWQITTTPGDYTVPVFDIGADLSNLASITIASGLLSSSTTYYWHVRYQDNQGAWSECSTETSFTTLDTVPPPVPTLVSPANWKKINNTCILDWSDVSDPSGVTYQIRLYNSSWSLLQEKSGLTASAYAVNSFGSLADGTYYWRVRAVDGAGNASAWTTSWAFKLDSTLPPVPLHLSPTCWKQVKNSATLDWSDVSDPSGVTYQIRLYNSSWSLVKEKTGLTSSAYTVSSFGSLADGTYYWRVRVVDGAGNASAWTTSWAFKLDNTLPSMPVHLSPTSWKKINSSATLDWSDVSDPSGVTYQIRLYNSSWSLVKEKTGLTSSAYAVSSFGALANGTYYWRVRAVDGAGNVGAWTTSWAFKLDNTLP